MTIETKYDIGDFVWFMDSNKIRNAMIQGIKVQRVMINPPTGCVLDNRTEYIGIGEWSRYEHEVFASKEELLKSL